MTLKFNCKKCGKKIIVQFLKKGETTKCRSCGAQNVIPEDAVETSKKPTYKVVKPIREEAKGEARGATQKQKLEKYKKNEGMGIGLGMPLIIFGSILARTGTVELGVIVNIIGAVLFIWGCCSWMKRKGYSSAWGLLGIFFIVGLIILACFPDRYKGIQQRD